jgi:CheY-like chemotaxis protein
VKPAAKRADILEIDSLAGAPGLKKVGILVIDDDQVSQAALTSILDAEGWRVRVVAEIPKAMSELASGQWSLVVVNVGLTDVSGPLFMILKDLAQGEADAPADAEVDDSGPRGIRVLFLVPGPLAGTAKPILTREKLPFFTKPYHLHDFLEKVSDLLVATGSIEDPIRSMSDFNFGSRAQRERTEAKRAPQNPMFASRDDYQMTEEEMLEWERSEAEAKKKSEEEKKERQQRF